MINMRTTTYFLVWLDDYLYIQRLDHHVFMKMTILLFSLSAKSLLVVPSVSLTKVSPQIIHYF